MRYFIQSKYTLLNTQKKGTGTPHLNVEILKKSKLVVPSLEKQKEVVSRIEELFSSLDNAVETLNKTKEQLMVYRQAVLKYVFETVYDAEEMQVNDICKEIKVGIVIKPSRFYTTKDNGVIVCDKQYAKKADDRTGGVGDETVIISSEVYGNMKQEKFIPIIAEKDEDGKPCVPTYIKTRIYIDLSDENTYEAEYEKLLRNIYEKPLFTKPKLGKKPEWLDEEKTDFFPLKDLIKQIKGSSTDNKRRSCIARFRSEYIEAMKTFWVKGVKADQEYELFLYTKPARDLFLDFVEVVAESDSDYAELLAEIFEEMYNTFTCVKTYDVGTMSGSDNDVDVFKIHIWELFICVIAYMRHVRDYKSINVVLTYTYFLNESIFGGNAKIKNYTEFRHHSRPIEDVYKPTTDQKQKFTLLGDVICNQREKLPIYTKNAIAEADLFLYQVCNGLSSSKVPSISSTGVIWSPVSASFPCASLRSFAIFTISFPRRLLK